MSDDSGKHTPIPKFRTESPQFSRRIRGRHHRSHPLDSVDNLKHHQIYHVSGLQDGQPNFIETTLLGHQSLKNQIKTKPLPEEYDIDNPDVIKREIEIARAKTQEHYQAIQEMLTDVGMAAKPEDVVIKIGPELEFTQIGDESAFFTRLSQVSHEAQAHQQGGEYVTFDINRKTQDHVPRAARYYELDKLLSPTLTMLKTPQYYKDFDAAFKQAVPDPDERSKEGMRAEFERRFILDIIHEVDPNFEADMKKSADRFSREASNTDQKVYENRYIANYLAANQDKSEKFREYFSRSNKRARFEPEPTFNINVFADGQLIRQEDGTSALFPTLRSGNQVEISYEPMTPNRIGNLLNKIMNRIVHGLSGNPESHGAKDVGLQRLDFRSVAHSECAPSSIHLNASLFVGDTNALSKRQWDFAEKLRAEGKMPHESPTWNFNDEDMGKPSELALCIGQAQNEFLRDWQFLFARSKNDYLRYEENEPSGPSAIGVTNRKEHGNFGSAMFRGEGKQTERLTSSAPTKPDKGDFRFELRVPGVGAAGHPNKEAYHNQEALPHQMMEAYMLMLRKGVEKYVERIKARDRGEEVPPITEESLAPKYKDYDDGSGRMCETLLFDQKSKALSQFVRSDEARAYYGDRMPLLLLLSDRLDLINREDLNPDREMGPHVPRLRGDHGKDLIRLYQGDWAGYADHFGLAETNLKS